MEVDGEMIKSILEEKSLSSIKEESEDDDEDEEEGKIGLPPTRNG